MNNFASNFGIGMQDFGYDIADGSSKALNVSQLHLTLAQFFQYFNANQADTVLTYTVLPGGYLRLDSTNAIAPRGNGWKMLGFFNLEKPASTILFSDGCFNFGQTPVFYVRFNNIVNAYNGGEVSASFMIPNNSSFGGVLIYDTDNLFMNQQIFFNYNISL